MDFEEGIRAHVDCCACGKSMRESRHINIINLNKRAYWKHITWGNVLVPGSGGRAVAIVCDTCIEEKREPIYAVEVNENFTEVRYHRVADLEEVPEIEC